MPTVKQCPRCKEILSIENFRLRGGKRKGYQAYCKECSKTKLSEWQRTHTKNNTDSARRWRDKNVPRVTQKRRTRQILKSCREHNITVEEYCALYDAQGGCCAICKEHQSEHKRRLALDHCHSTGTVRAFLCGRCNTSLGLMRDSPSLLRLAALYLEKYQQP